MGNRAIYTISRMFWKSVASTIKGGVLPSLGRIEAPLDQREESKEVSSSQALDFSRECLARRYLDGSGIEIGAFSSPLKVPDSLSVTYVDNCSVTDALRSLSVCNLTHVDFGIEERNVVSPDVIDDGQYLQTIGDNSQDFVIANHVLEHYENPLAGFANMLRVTRHGGIIYVALPDMRRCFDRTREPTTLEHVLRDYQEGPEWSREQAFREFGNVFISEGMAKGLFPKLAGSELDAFTDDCISQLMASGFSIHFHAWTPDLMLEMFLSAKRYLKMPFEFELFYPSGDEVLFIFKKA
ncbi:methyltransferase domain-containing protein [Thioalkalicoccus limnaeus]|uniref:Methyltransferase domain-containing protein n=1 Tax=Thioalkalicoccus limnaeus TaxID=120681 RepID=A0ABV4B9K2_9GAMM